MSKCTSIFTAQSAVPIYTVLVWGWGGGEVEQVIVNREKEIFIVVFTYT